MVVPSGRPLPEVWSPAKNPACLNPQQDKGRQTWFKVKNFNSGIRDVGLDPDFAMCQFMTLPKLLNFIFLSVKIRITTPNIRTVPDTWYTAAVTFQVRWRDYGLCSVKPGFKSKINCILSCDLQHVI